MKKYTSRFWLTAASVLLFAISMPVLAGADHSFTLQSAQIISTSNAFDEAIGAKNTSVGFRKTVKNGKASKEVNDKHTAKIGEYIQFATSENRSKLKTETRYIAENQRSLLKNWHKTNKQYDYRLKT